MFLSQSIFIAQNAGTSLIIHNRRSGKLECGLAKKSSQIRENRAQGCADQTCFPDLQKPNPKNLRAAF